MPRDLAIVPRAFTRPAHQVAASVPRFRGSFPAPSDRPTAATRQAVPIHHRSSSGHSPDVTREK
jgi:hypothetical protein